MSAIETFRGISVMIFKWLAIAIAAFAVLIAAWVSFAYAYHWYSFQRHADAIQIFVSTDKEKCPNDQFPIQVMIGNASGRTLEATSFTLAARIKGRSTDVAKYHSYKDDHIVEPTYGYASCWAVPGLNESVSNPRDLDWSISSKYFTFKE